MHTRILSIASIVAAISLGCAPPVGEDMTPDLAPNPTDLAAPEDQQPSPPPCPAAHGISGEVLLCADFSKIQSLADPSLGNWNFKADGAMDCWQILENTLTNKDVANIDWSCAVSLPALDLTDPTIAKYNRIIFSINYTLDLKGYQQADISLTANDLGVRGEGYLFGHGGFEPQQIPIVRTNIVSIKRIEMPSVFNNVYKLYIRLLERSKGVESHGWQISSLAILGAP